MIANMKDRELIIASPLIKLSMKRCERTMLIKIAFMSIPVNSIQAHLRLEVVVIVLQR